MVQGRLWGDVILKTCVYDVVVVSNPLLVDWTRTEREDPSPGDGERIVGDSDCSQPGDICEDILGQSCHPV